MDATPPDDVVSRTGFNRAAAITRSLLGYGVIAGPIYLVTGLIQAVVRDGFDLSLHPLSLLANGPWGWIQIVNLIVCGLMVVAAAVGFARAMRPSRAVSISLAVYGVGLVLGGVFVADPMDGFPPGTPDGAPDSVSVSGVLHLMAGGLGFVALAVAYVLLGRWLSGRGDGRLARWSYASAGLVAVGFAGGAATAGTALGVALLWVAVGVGWGWLAIASVVVYRTVPHPDGGQPSGAAAGGTVRDAG